MSDLLPPPETTFEIALAYCLAASLLRDSLLAPVMTIFPVAKIRAVVLVGSFIRMMTAANLLGLYSAFLHLKAMSLRLSWEQFKFAVLTKF